MSMERDLTGKTAVVTGASRGIGRAIAQRLAARGAAVAVGCRSRIDLAEEVVAGIEEGGGHAFAHLGDVEVEADLLGLFDETERRFGRLDIVVANAGYPSNSPFAEHSVADFDTIVASQLRGVFLTLREAARRVRDQGRVVALSTAGTQAWVPDQGLYLGVKGAVEQFVRVLSRELGPRGITVNAVSPAGTDTDAILDFQRDISISMSALRRLAHPDEVAEVVAFLASPRGGWVTGQNIAASGGVV